MKELDIKDRQILAAIAGESVYAQLKAAHYFLRMCYAILENLALGARTAGEAEIGVTIYAVAANVAQVQDRVEALAESCKCKPEDEDKGVTNGGKESSEQVDGDQEENI